MARSFASAIAGEGEEWIDSKLPFEQMELYEKKSLAGGSFFNVCVYIFCLSFIGKIKAVDV
jgi:hypothetical protein